LHPSIAIFAKVVDCLRCARRTRCALRAIRGFPSRNDACRNGSDACCNRNNCACNNRNLRRNFAARD